MGGCVEFSSDVDLRETKLEPGIMKVLKSSRNAIKSTIIHQHRHLAAVKVS